MNKYLEWFRRFIWIGAIVNMGFAIPALLKPGLLNTMLGLPSQAFYPWMGNVGMLLVGVSLFYLPAGTQPNRWTIYSWLCVVSRIIAVLFWISLVRGVEYPKVFVPMLIIDSVMMVLLGVTLQLGISADAKFSFTNLKKLGCYFIGGIKKTFQSRKQRFAWGIAAILIAFVGSQAWYFLLRKLPDPTFASDIDQFKYAPIGLGVEARIPQYVFEVLPKICGLDKGYESFGFVFEPGKQFPIGLAQRHIGYPTVEPNCALCHTGAYQVSEDDLPIPLPTAPANTIDLESFQWFMYDCVASKNFTADAVMQSIKDRHELGFMESLFYRYGVYNLTKMMIGQQQQKYSWQKRRPTQGIGRTDTFNPTKINVFGFPDDGTIGTVDLPQIWNQRKREGMWLHWDGNNNQIHERNYAAAMAVGATPSSVITANFNRVTNWLLDTAPPAYPFQIDADKSARGKVTWNKECADCHDFGKTKTGQVTESISDLGTDPHRLDSFTIGLVDKLHTFKKTPFDFGAYRKTQSYSNTPTDGAWARAPYLHNGSVPSIWDLLQPEDMRPEIFYRGYKVYDPEHVGFVTTGEAAKQKGFRFDTTLPGNANSGHNYGTGLTDAEKWDLVEYIKTL